MLRLFSRRSQKPWKRLLIGLCIATSVLMIQGCKPSATLPLKPPPPALAEPCPPLGEIRDGQAGTVLRWSVATAKAYRLCQLKQAGLVEAWPK